MADDPTHILGFPVEYCDARPDEGQGTHALPILGDLSSYDRLAAMTAQERSMMMAEQLVGQLNAYEQLYVDEPYDANPWDDVIAPVAAERWDTAATAAPDGSDGAAVVVFTDGSAVIRRQDTRRWVALWPAPTTRT